jgi:2-hydroxychromene-2-carboxylate isomerase
MPKTVEFSDYQPTAYLAWTRLPAIVERAGAKLVYRPMFLGA